MGQCYFQTFSTPELSFLKSLTAFTYRFVQLLQKFIYNLEQLTIFHMAQSADLKPMQLISFDSSKRLQVNAQAVTWLTSVSQDKHLGVITVVGKYRTGKSYILNRVLINQNKGFEVGPTINACTKGLWVWPELIDNPNDPGTKYMIMDTEGLGSLEQGEQTDTKIFLMALLLSSYFIYNSVGSIDEKAVQNLSLIINLSKMLQKGEQRDRQTIIDSFPSFLWLVRDFALRLVDEKGFTISPEQYLENALKPQKGTSDLAARKNSIRKQLVTFFKERDCFTLIRPVDDEAKLQNMSKVRDEDLRPRFKELIKQLRKKIFYQAKRKSFKGKPCSPGMFVQLCQHFCQAINNGGLPEIQSNWQMICKSECARIQKRCSDEFYGMLQKYQDQPTDSLNAREMQRQLNGKLEQVLKYYEKNALGNKQEKKRELKEKMLDKIEQFKKNISREKNKEMDRKFEEICDKLDTEINSNSITSVFDISEQFDRIIEKEQSTTLQSQLFIYAKAYEGFKNATFTYFGNSKQLETHKNSLLTQKLNIYQNSLNRIQEDQAKKNDQAQKRERELRQNIHELQMKAKKVFQDLQKARGELTKFHNKKVVDSVSH